MSLRDRIRSSRRLRARDLTVEGIGDFKLLIPSAARLQSIRARSATLDPKSEAEWMPFVGEIVAEHMVDENFERAYAPTEVDALLEDIDPFALGKIYAAILSPADPEAAEKNSESIPKDSSPTPSPTSTKS